MSSTSTGGCSNLAVLSHWPLARRAAQLVVVPVLDFDMSSVKVAAQAGAGGILLLGNATPPTNLKAQLSTAFASTAPGLGPLVMADEEGGGVQRLMGAVASMPWARDMAETMTPQQVQALAADVGRAMLQLGVDVDLAPVLDLDAGAGPNETDADGSRSFSASASTATRYGIAFMRGLQSAGVLPVLKHFPGLGGSTGNTDYGTASTPPLATLESGGLTPFRAAIAAGAPAVMVSNAAIPGLTDMPASVSPQALGGLLRHDLGFGGLVLTDSLSAGAITQAGLDVPTAAVAAIKSGADLVLFGSTLTPAQTLLLKPQNLASTINAITDALVAATQAGTINVQQLDTAVDQVLAAKHANLC